MYFLRTAAAVRLKCSCGESPALTATKTAAVPTVRIAILVTFTVRIGSTSSVCTRNVRMSRAS